MATKVEGAGQAGTPAPVKTEGNTESAKRLQILEGARRVFLRSGFAAASMGEIAREAKVSKGTLYVYFDSKEALFTALMADAKAETSERLVSLDFSIDDPRTFLTHLASGLMEKFCQPKHIAMVRLVMGAADAFPAMARQFYEAGAGYGHGRLAGWLAEQHEAGRLNVPDPETAAWQFMSLCCHPTSVCVTLGGLPPPGADEIRKSADETVRTFLAAFGPDARR